MEDYDKNEELGEEQESLTEKELFSKIIRAGKRTYFFDVKSTRYNELYLSITESIRRYRNDGRFYYEKHQIFLYKEDFERFTEVLVDLFDYINLRQAEMPISNRITYEEPYGGDSPKEEPAGTFLDEENESELEATFSEKTGEQKDYTRIEFDDLTS